MIYQDKLNLNNVRSVYLTGKADHYMPVPRNKILETTEYDIKASDSINTISEFLFKFSGGGESNWTILCNTNRLRRPQDWRTGETLKIPLVIVLRKDFNLDRFRNA